MEHCVKHATQLQPRQLGLPPSGPVQLRHTRPTPRPCSSTPPAQPGCQQSLLAETGKPGRRGWQRAPPLICTQEPRTLPFLQNSRGGQGAGGEQPRGLRQSLAAALPCRRKMQGKEQQVRRANRGKTNTSGGSCKQPPPSPLTHAKAQHGAAEDELREGVGPRLQARPQQEQAAGDEHSQLHRRRAGGWVSGWQGPEGCQPSGSSSAAAGMGRHLSGSSRRLHGPCGQSSARRGPPAARPLPRRQTWPLRRTAAWRRGTCSLGHTGRGTGSAWGALGLLTQLESHRQPERPRRTPCGQTTAQGHGTAKQRAASVPPGKGRQAWEGRSLSQGSSLFSNSSGKN